MHNKDPFIYSLIQRKLLELIFVFIIEEVFLSMDEDVRRKMLEDIAVNIIKHEKNSKEVENYNYGDSVKKDI